MNLEYTSETSSCSSGTSISKKTSNKKPKQSMQWTEDHDKMLMREILALDPFTGTKKGTPQRGQRWKEIVENLNSLKQPTFILREFRAVRDHYSNLRDKLQAKVRYEERASGISTEMSEVETALEEAIALENNSKKEEAMTSAKKKAEDQDKANAEEMRAKAMERLGQTRKRKGDNETDAKQKRRSNGNDTIVYLREKNESMQEIKREEMDIKKQEIELKKHEFELQSKRQDDLMKMMISQQQQQAKATQDMSNLMLAVLSRFGQK